MTSDDLVIQVITALNASGVPYMLTGSLASNVYGNPRSTKDADFVIGLGDASVDVITRRLPAWFQLDTQMTFETITMTSRHRVYCADTKFMFEFFLLSSDAHDQARFNRRLRGRVLDQDVYIPTAEDVIITKLRWSRGGARGKDIDDARNVLHVQHDRLDWAYLTEWCTRHGTIDQLQDLRRGLPSQP